MDTVRVIGVIDDPELFIFSETTDNLDQAIYLGEKWLTEGEHGGEVVEILIIYCPTNRISPFRKSQQVRAVIETWSEYKGSILKQKK